MIELAAFFYVLEKIWVFLILLVLLCGIFFVLFEDWRINKRNKKRKDENKKHG